MLCCAKTGVQVKRCNPKTLENVNTPKSRGYSNDIPVYTGILPFVAQSSKHDDNFDATGMIRYRTFILMLPESVYQLNKWKINDELSYNDGLIGTNKAFDLTKLIISGKIYSVRELLGSLKSKIKYREVKIRFDLQ